MLVLAAPAAGQATQAAIIGVVADSSGAVLPGVTITATGPALQVPQVETVTNERGEYRLGPLPVGLTRSPMSFRDFRPCGEKGCVWRLGSWRHWTR